MSSSRIHFPTSNSSLSCHIISFSLFSYVAISLWHPLLHLTFLLPLLLLHSAFLYLPTFQTCPGILYQYSHLSHPLLHPTPPYLCSSTLHPSTSLSCTLPSFTSLYLSLPPITLHHASSTPISFTPLFAFHPNSRAF